MRTETDRAVGMGRQSIACSAHERFGEPHHARMAPRLDQTEVTLALPARESDLQLGRELGVAAVARDPTRWQLVLGTTDLDLVAPDAIGGSRIAVSLSTGPLARRLRTSRPDEPLLRAIGVTRGHAAPHVLDATAGLGRDALVMTHHGCTVDAIERVAAFVLLVRAAIVGTSIERRLRLVAGEAIAWMEALPAERRPDVVYLDPMFAEEGRAQVKKDMQALRLLAAPPVDAEALFATAMRTARHRVVCKRHPDGPALGGKPSFVVEGERVRFDVHVIGTRAT